MLGKSTRLPARKSERHILVDMIVDIDRDRSGLRSTHAEYQIQKGRFSGTGGTDERRDTSGGHV